jgi:serine/threonine protein kinase
VLETDTTHVSTETHGTLAYQPAELLRDGKLAKSVDVYSFGMIMWEMYAGRRIFENQNTGQVSLGWWGFSGSSVMKCWSHGELIVMPVV